MPLLPCHISLLQCNLSTFAMGCPSKTCECKIRSSTSFLVVDTIPYVIAGTCSMSMNANLSFLLLNLIFAAMILLCTGIPSLLFGEELTTVKSTQETRLFIVERCEYKNSSHLISSQKQDVVWLWFLLHCIKWYISTNCLEFQVISFRHCGMEIDGVFFGGTQWSFSG